ncbi:hypothetical protein D3C71_1923260 [compost metagenome]
MAHRSDHHVVGTLDIDGVFQVPLFVSDLEDVLARVDRRTVDQAMHPAQAFDDLVEGSVGSVLAGDVTHRDRHLHTLPAQLFCCL